jgi:flagellar biosynthesis regulator FlbT
MMQRHHLQTRKRDRHDTELICSDCHKHIHAFFENRQVAKELNTIDALLANEEFGRALSFIRKQAPGSRTRVKTTRRRRR